MYNEEKKFPSISCAGKTGQLHVIYINIHMLEYYSAIKKKLKKNEILPFVKIQMDLKGIMLSEISQTEKDKYHMISLICGIYK